MIPGLENAEIVRYGVMHRNTFLNSPKILRSTYQSQKRDDLFFAGQMTGVEGYVESAASGLLAGLNAARMASGQECVVFPKETMIGAMSHYITNTDSKHFQPMNANFGIIEPLGGKKIRDKQLKNQMIADKALAALDEFVQTI
jgi:methylenetetrahydrofolate--tRNA-(uracil-5-)-methyltransferase